MYKITAGIMLDIYNVPLEIFTGIPKPILCTKFNYYYQVNDDFDLSWAGQISSNLFKLSSICYTKV